MVSKLLPAARKLSDTLEAAPDAMIVVNRDCDILAVNSQTERLFGFGRHEIIGHNVQILLPPRYRADPSYRRQFFAAPSLGAGMELCGQRKDGTEFPIEIRASLIESKEGTLASSAIRDITERKEYERALKEKNSDLEDAVSELDAFCYSVSHDLRAPLRAMDGFSRILLQDRSVSNLDSRAYLQAIRDNAVQTGELVDGLLAFARLGRTPLSKQRVYTPALVEQIVADAKKQAKGRSVGVTIGELPDIWGDPVLLKQVFVNLIDNAFKYTRSRRNAEIEIGVRETDGEHVVFVRDNGVGFDMQYAGKLFGVFHRLHRAEDFEGTGVGLAIVQRIVQRHGMRVWAEAEFDKGATFFFTTEGIPLAK